MFGARGTAVFSTLGNDACLEIRCWAALRNSPPTCIAQQISKLVPPFCISMDPRRRKTNLPFNVSLVSLHCRSPYHENPTKPQRMMPPANVAELPVNPTILNNIETLKTPEPLHPYTLTPLHPNSADPLDSRDSLTLNPKALPRAREDDDGRESASSVCSWQAIVRKSGTRPIELFLRNCSNVS